MSRGIMYHVGTERGIGDYTAMDESDFYESLGALGVDYVKNQHAENAKESVQNLVSRLCNAGFKGKLATDPDYEGFYFFDTGSKDELLVCKSKYFAGAFASLQKMVNEMALATFASDGSEEFVLRSLISNEAGDAVYFGEYLEAAYSLDSFVRKLEPNITYYITPETVYLH